MCLIHYILKSSEAIQYISVINRLKSFSPKKGTLAFYSATMWLILSKCGIVFNLDPVCICQIS